MSSKEAAAEAENLASSDAFQVLDILVDNGEVSLEKREQLKQHYATLHTCLAQAIIKENSLHEEFERLRHILSEEERNVKDVVHNGEAATIELLREDLESSISEETLAQERQQLLQLEVQELQRQRGEFASKIQELAALHAAALVPLVSGLESEVQAAKDQLGDEKARYEKESKALDHVKVHLVKVEHSDYLAAIERARILMENKERHYDDVKKDLELAGIEADKILADAVDLDLQLKEESRVEDKTKLFKLSYDEVGLLEEDVAALKHEAQQRSTLLANLGSQRDRTARLYSQHAAKLKEAGQVSKLREMEVTDLKKVKRDVSARIQDFEQLHNLVKNQRNKFVTLIQSANQSKTEMEEKLKILHSELSILQNEVLEKDKLLLQACNLHATAITERDQLRSDLNQLGMTFRDKQDSVEEQVAEVGKLNSIITATEREMLRFEKQYEVVIEARNYTGIMLIDRNDELCILYEKLNALEQLTKIGQLELLKRDDEVRVVTLEIAQLQHSVEVTKLLVPIVPKLDEDVAGLQKELLNARREAETLGAALENPENSKRWRKLGGKVPHKDEVAVRLQHLEERLSNKKEQLLEKELILEQITSLSLQLREEAKQGRPDTLDVARSASQYQTKLRSASRRIMAIISELSMYQEAALKLNQEMVQLETAVQAARERSEQGIAPTEEAEKEWQNMTRIQQMSQEMHANAAFQQAAEATSTWGAPSMAEVRPNAYIPDSLGIPKPYGRFSPFKPTETGSTMRHIWKPQPQPVVI